MRHAAGCIVGWAVMFLAVATSPFAAERSVGQQEYEARCAMCHGLAGKGDGWLAGYLTYRVPSLSQLKKNNGEVFPFDRVYQVIDGRREVLVHGPRACLFGAVFTAWNRIRPTARLSASITRTKG